MSTRGLLGPIGLPHLLSHLGPAGLGGPHVGRQVLPSWKGPFSEGRGVVFESSRKPDLAEIQASVLP